MGTVDAAPDARSRRQFHPLRVSGIDTLTNDAVALTFDVPPALREHYAFGPGQHLALVRHHEGAEIRRSYSVCSGVGGPLRVAVKLLPDGAFSTWVHDGLRVGDELEVLPPSGRFTLDLEPTHCRHYVAIAAGSGITPVFSILASALAIEPGSRCTLIYGNRTTSSIMFLEELEELKDRHGPRLHLLHVLSREPQDVELSEGRIDAAKLDRMLSTVLPPETVDEWFLCGPMRLVETATSVLEQRGVDVARIHRELFYGDDAAPAPAPRREASEDGASVSFVLDGRRGELVVAQDGPPILDVVLAVRPDAPYACKGGVCGTCRCRVTAGEVRMDRAYALEPDEIAAGVVLACQAHPVTDAVTLDFDAV